MMSLPEARGAAIELARTLEGSGRADRAATVLRKLADSLPGDGEVLFLLAQTLENSGQEGPAARQYRRAEVLVRRALERPGAGPDLHLVLGRILFHRKLPSHAARALRGALRLSPDLPQARELLDEIQRQRDRGARTGGGVQGPSRAATSVRDRVNLAAASAANRLEELLAKLREIKRRKPPADAGVGEPFARYQLEASLLDFDEASRFGEAALDRSRDYENLKSLSVPFLFANFDLEAIPESHRERSLARAEEFISRRPRSPWGYLFRRLLNKTFKTEYSRMNDDVRRLSSFHAGRYGWLGFETGQHLLSIEDFDGALAQLEAAAACARPVDWISRCYQAEALLCQGRGERALSLLDSLRGVVRAEDEGSVAAWKVKLLIWLGRYGEALKLLDFSPARSSNEADLRTGAAFCGLGRWAQALPVLDRAARALPDELECRVWKVEALFRLGRHREALRAASRAEPLNAYQQNLYFHVARGLVRGATGDSLGMRLDYNAVRQRSHLLDFLTRRQRRKLERYDDGFIADSLATVLRLSKGVRRGNHEICVWMKP